MPRECTRSLLRTTNIFESPDGSSTLSLTRILTATWEVSAWALLTKWFSEPLVYSGFFNEALLL